MSYSVKTIYQFKKLIILLVNRGSFVKFLYSKQLTIQKTKRVTIKIRIQSRHKNKLVKENWTLINCTDKQKSYLPIRKLGPVHGAQHASSYKIFLRKAICILLKGCNGKTFCESRRT